jgi:pyridoxal phosphate enzyme (YggS family)
VIPENLSAIRAQIHQACLQTGRAPATVHLLAVSKTKPASAVAAALDAGQRDFGENYLQDALPKIAQYPQATWHFIGQIQSNKTKDIATHFDVVHGLASEKIARRLNDARPIGCPPLKAFIQVNLVNESAKNGVVPEALPGLVTRVQDCQNLQLLGLMAMPPATFDLSERHRFFSELAGLQAQIKADFDLPQFQELSMGMSDDLETAIACGATWVRVGTAIFGARQSQQEA